MLRSGVRVRDVQATGLSARTSQGKVGGRNVAGRVGSAQVGMARNGGGVSAIMVLAAQSPTGMSASCKAELS